MDAKQFQKIAKALADPRRFEILEVIAQATCEELCCGSIVEKFPVAQATISHHLKELAAADLIEAESKGQFKYFRLRADIFNEYLAELQRRITCNIGSQQAVPAVGNEEVGNKTVEKSHL